MIEGAVNADREAVITLAVHGPSGRTREIEAVVDTGFSGFLTVTPALVMELGLDYRSRGRARRMRSWDNATGKNRAGRRIPSGLGKGRQFRLGRWSLVGLRG